MGDIRWSRPLDDEAHKDASCITDLLHVHVWPDSVGINVRTHGNTLFLGKWPREVPNGGRVDAGWFFDWRVRRAVHRLDRQVEAIKARQAAIARTYGRLQDVS